MLPSSISYEPSLNSHLEDDGDHLHDDDTGKKSFNFTGELNRLNEGSVQLSFVEQLSKHPIPIWALHLMLDLSHN